MTAHAPPAKLTPLPPSTRALTIEQVTGLWRLQTGPGHDQKDKTSCLIALNRLTASRSDGAQAYGVHIEQCAIPALAEAAAWRLAGGGFELLSPQGQAVARFRPHGEDGFETDDGRYGLERAPMT